ncbi:MAG: hypothetical protein WB814_02100, partial [Candidatus Sulfotelmatobacter sp.]
AHDLRRPGNAALISWQVVGELEISAWREELGSGRNAGIGPAGFTGEKKNPSPVYGAGSSVSVVCSTPNAGSLAEDCYAMVSAMLNVDEIETGLTRCGAAGHRSGLYQSEACGAPAVVETRTAT